MKKLVGRMQYVIKNSLRKNSFNGRLGRCLQDKSTLINNLSDCSLILFSCLFFILLFVEEFIVRKDMKKIFVLLFFLMINIAYASEGSFEFNFDGGSSR